MSKNYFGKSSTVLVAVGFLALLSTGANAQTTADAKLLRSNTNLRALTEVQAELKRTVVSPQRLKSFAKEKSVPYRFEGEDGKVLQLVAIDGAGNPLYLTTTNEKAAITSQVNFIQEGGLSGYDLSGKDVKIVEWDGGRVRDTHQELRGKITKGADTGDVINSLNDHATHVAGTVLATGVNKKAKGMAPKANIISYDFNNSYNEIYASLGKQEGVLSTHSYGFNCGWVFNGLFWQWAGDKNVSTVTDYKFGYYSEYDELIDMMLKAAPWHTFVRAASNDRGDGPQQRPEGQELDGGDTGYDTVPFGAVAKNAIVVGAVKPVLSYQGPQSVEMTSFSSWGPTDDGRIIPTLVADGNDVYSSVSRGDDSYAEMSGTSMATPATTGALALLQEYAKRKTGKFFTSPLIKAILINSTKEAGNVGPDYIYGYGLLDAKAAVETVANKGKSTEYREGNLTNGETVTLKFITQEGVPFRASLAWLDKEGKPKAKLSDRTPKDPSFLNDRTPKLVYDLDLRVTQNGVEYLPYVLDPANPAKEATKGDNVVDNMEQIYIPNPKSGELILTIKSKGTLDAEGVHYGLAVSGIAVDNDLSVESIEATVSHTEASASVPVTATIKNVGKNTFGKFEVKFTAKDPSGTQVSEAKVNLDTIGVGETKQVSANLELKDAFTNYIVTAEIVSTEDLIEGNNFKQISVSSVVVDLRKGGTVLLEDFNNSFNDHGWKIVNVDPNTPTWDRAKPNWTYDGTHFAVNANAGAVAEDWLFTNPVLLQQGSRYKVSYVTAKNSSNPERNENLEVYVGDTQEVASMGTTPLHKFTWETKEKDAVFKTVEFEFVAQKTGVQFFGLKHYSAPGKSSWLIALDNFKVQNLEQGVPSPDFTYSVVDGSKIITKYNDVKLENITESNPAVTSWKWEFVPNTVTFQAGTDATSEKPVVRFNEEGEYTVKLTATNANGATTKAKYNHIQVQQPTIKAAFRLDRTNIYTKENVQFINLTSGTPNATSFKWTITPNETGAFSYLEGTNPSSDHLNVQFNKVGTYSVKLEVNSEAGVKVAELNNVITVKGNTNAPQNLKADYANSSITVNWEKPELKYQDSYINETFELGNFPPTGWQVLDANEDKNTWNRVRFVQAGQVTAAVLSWDRASNKGIQTDDYLASTKIDFLPSGYTELTFNAILDKSYPDNLKIYYVKVKDDTPLTKEQILAGTKIFDGVAKMDEVNKIDISSVYDSTPFKLVFYSSNFDLFAIAIDNVKISLPGTVTNAVMSSSNAMQELNKQDFYLAQEKADGSLHVGTNSVAPVPDWETIQAGYSNNVTGYEVYKNDKFLATVNTSNTVYIDNSITQNGRYCYKTVAIYDGINKSQASNEHCVDVNDSNLSTVDVNLGNAETVVYPNPVVDVVKVKFAKPTSGKVTVELYAADGKKVLTKSVVETELSDSGVNVSQLSSGVYILVVKDGTKAYTTKVIKK